MDDHIKGLVEHLRKNGSTITVRETPRFLSVNDLHPIPQEQAMTNEQEQLIRKIAAGLQKSDPLEYYEWQNAYERFMCESEPTALKDDFKHTPDCPLILAQQLLATLKDNGNDE